MKVANACCEGRLVSVLEGGYRVQGGEASPFARSVAAHVRTLAERHNERWSFADAAKERDAEDEKRREKERQNMLLAGHTPDVIAALMMPSTSGAIADAGGKVGICVYMYMYVFVFAD